MDKLTEATNEFFQKTFMCKEIAAGFLERYLSEELLQELDLSTLTLQEELFADEETPFARSHVVYKCGVDGSHEELYILLARLHEPDRKVALELLQYMNAIWSFDAEREENEEEEEEPYLLAIVPIVVYHGSEPWDVPLTLSGIIENYEALSDAMKAHIPDFTYILADITKDPSLRMLS